MNKKMKQTLRKIGRCRLCKGKDKGKIVDYKDIQDLQRFCDQQGKVLPRRRSNNCLKHQRMVERAVKTARFMALISYPGMS